MKISYELLRMILIDANEYFNAPMSDTDKFIMERFPDKAKSDVETHLGVLIDMGILSGTKGTSISIKGVAVPKGYDLLQVITKESVWIETKSKLDPIDECPIALVFHTAEAIFLQSKS